MKSLQITSRVLVAFLGVLLSFILIGNISPIQAGSTLSLSPGSGNVNNTFAVDVLWNSGGNAAVAVSFNVSFTGTVTYTSNGGSSITGCSPFVTGSTSPLQIDCLLAPVGATYNGTSGRVIRLNFTSTGTGSSDFTVSNVVVGYENTSLTVTDVGSSATYTLVASGGKIVLPDTGIMDKTTLLILLSSVILIIGAVEYYHAGISKWLVLTLEKINVTIEKKSSEEDSS